MKRITLIGLSIVCALLITELVLRFIIGYPVYGLSYKVHYRIGGDYWTNVWKPNSRYWSVEGGNKVYSRNNYGLPGTDIDLKAKKKVALLGSSYLEGYQINPRNIATSVFAGKLKDSGYPDAVYNLGCSGHDPYDSYFRALLYDNQIKQDLTILVINSDNAEWFKRHPKPLQFEPDKEFGLIKTGKKTQLQILFRNKSALATLLASVKLNRSGAGDETDLPAAKGNKKAPVVTDDFRLTLVALKAKFPELMVLSIVTDQNFNQNLADFCAANQIFCLAKPLLVKENMIKGKGHLNERGNQKLGEFIFESYLHYLDMVRDTSKATDSH